MKSEIEGFVWRLSIVHRSLLPSLFNLEILKPQPVQVSPYTLNVLSYRGPDTVFSSPLPYCERWGLPPSYHLLEPDRPTLAHTNDDSRPCHKTVLLCGDGLQGLWARADGLCRQRTGPQKTHAIPWGNTWRGKYKKNRTMVELQKTGCVSWGW